MSKRGTWIVFVGLASMWVLRCGMEPNGARGPEDGGSVDLTAPEAEDTSREGLDIPFLEDGADLIVEGPPVCNQGDLETALVDAQSTGATVIVGPGCRIEGTFLVPAGVRLRGEAGAVLATPADDSVRRPVLTVEAAGTQTTSVTELEIRSASNYAIAVRGSGTGAVELKDLRVFSTRGVGIGAERLSSLELTNVLLDGSHTATELRRSDPSLADPDDEATHGLVVVHGGHVSLTGVSIRGFAAIGGVLIDDDIAWSTGVVEENGLAGVVAHGARGQMTDVAIRGLRSEHAFPIESTFDETRSWTGPPTFGAVFLGDSSVETTDLTVERVLHYGVAHDGGTAVHEGLTVRSCGGPAIWAQDVQSFTLHGTTGVPALLENNRFAGVLLHGPSAVNITDLAVVGTAWGCQDCGTLDEVRAGDGIQVALPKGAVAIRNANLVDNARIGLLLDMGGVDLGGVELSNITVTGGERAFGACAQNATGDDIGWDEGISRTDPLAFNDGNIDGELFAIGRPLPAKAFPAVSRIARDGLVGIVDPEPPH